MLDKNQAISILVSDLNIGGIEKNSIHLSNFLVRNGYKVDLLLIKSGGDLSSMLDSRVNRIDFKSRSIKNSFFSLLKYFFRENPFACFVNSWPITIFAICAKLICFNNVKLIVCEHTTWSKDEIYQEAKIKCLIPLSMRFFYFFAHKIICVSKGSANDLHQLTNISKNKIEVIYNPIQTSLALDYSMLTNYSYWQNGDHKKLIAVGSLKPSKDYFTLFRAIKILKEDLKIKLLVLGDGPLYKNLIKLREDLGLEDCIIMPGFEKEPLPLMASADLLVLSSAFEGFGNVIVESFSVGTPVVSTDCPHGPNEIISNSSLGILAKVNDPASIANAIKKSFSMSYNEESLKSRANEFSIEIAGNKYLRTII
jgi:glycosyltransferase involved in cell wall biosynthesis